MALTQRVNMLKELTFLRPLGNPPDYQQLPEDDEKLTFFSFFSSQPQKIHFPVKPDKTTQNRLQFTTPAPMCNSVSRYRFVFLVFNFVVFFKKNPKTLCRSKLIS